jgi:hypothetical protein
MLGVAGLPVRPEGVVFAEGVTRQVLAGGAVCQAGRGRLDPGA